MSIKCLNCGYYMSTFDEVKRFASELVVRIGPALLNAVLSRGHGFSAHPMNAMEVSCPNCGARGRWEDVRT